jgi:hypothetical protein
MRLLALVMSVFVLAFAGCGGDGERSDATTTTTSAERTVPGPRDPEAPLITYTRSGGIAFTSVELAVQAGGDAVLRVESGPGKPQEQEFELEAAELEELRALVASIDPEAVDVETDIACADCFEYRLVFPPGEEIAFADVPGPPAEVEPLLTELNEIVDGHGAGDLPNGG